jgi:hypothetical protein
MVKAPSVVREGLTMSALALAVIVAWLVEAVALGYVMRRKGYDGYAWMLLAFFIGPIAVAIAANVILRPVRQDPRLLREGAIRAEGLKVLVAIDGSPESAAAASHVAALLGKPMARVTFAHVVPLDGSLDAEVDAEEQLTAATDAHPELDATNVVLRGEPTATLCAYAAAGDYDILVAGGITEAAAVHTREVVR